MQLSSAFILHDPVDQQMLESLDAAVDDAVAAGLPELSVDLGGLAVLETAAISKLIASLRKMHDAGGNVRLTGAGKGVLETLRVTGLDRIFDVVEAAAAVRSPSAALGRSVLHRKHGAGPLQGTSR